MAADEQGRQRANAAGPQAEHVSAPKLTPTADSHQSGDSPPPCRFGLAEPLELRGRPCPHCGADLGGATLLRRNWRTIRSGHRQGARAKLLRVRCACGAETRHYVDILPSPWCRGAA